MAKPKAAAEEKKPAEEKPAVVMHASGWLPQAICDNAKSATIEVKERRESLEEEEEQPRKNTKRGRRNEERNRQKRAKNDDNQETEPKAETAQKVPQSDIATKEESKEQVAAATTEA